MNRSTTAAILVLTALVLPACQQDTSPSPGMGDSYPAPMNDPQISVLSPELQPWLRFQPAIVVNDGRRPMQVQLPVRNTTNEQYLIDYRVLYFNENNVQLEPTMGWTRANLLPKQIVRLEGKALDLDARTYKVEIKWAR